MTPADLKKWRKARGLSQEALGNLLGVKRQTINNWEKGRVSMPPYLWMALAYLATKK